MSAKHTTGPWSAEPTCPNDGVNCWFIVSEDRKQVGSVDGYQGDPEREANARLIAAAPDLLEALQNVVDAWSSQFERQGHMAPEWAKKARAAITKATGEGA